MTCRRFVAAALVALSLAGRGAAADDFASTTIDLGVVVSDVAKSVKFYTEAIGCVELPGFKVDGPYVGKVGLTDGSEGLDVHVLALAQAPQATKLKLMQFKRAPGADDTQAINSQLGFRYLTIVVVDIDKAMDRLKKAGVKPVTAPHNLPEGLPQEIYLTVVRDPDGNFVELVGPKSAPASK